MPFSHLNVGLILKLKLILVPFDCDVGLIPILKLMLKLLRFSIMMSLGMSCWDFREVYLAL